MELVNKIINNQLYQSYLKNIEELEKDRIYCRHNISHFMDVARIAYIKSMEMQVPIDKRLIYAAALLHDIGRYEQYVNHIPHELAGGIIGREILTQCGFGNEEVEIIIYAIVSHREIKGDERMDLSGILYQADKLSRLCFSCKERKTCNWDEIRKNSLICL